MSEQQLTRAQRRCKTGKRKPRHGYCGVGKKKHPLYRVRDGMIARCYGNHKDAANWKGRGIQICQEWRDSPVAFIEWCLANGWEKGLTVERKDNDGHYEPGNVKFVTRTVQMRNTRNNRMVTINGETRCVTEWCELYGLNYATMYSRRGKGAKKRSIDDVLKEEIAGRQIPQ